MLYGKGVKSGKKFQRSKKIFYAKNAKNGHLGEIWKTETYGHTVLPVGSLIIRQKLVENAKIKKCQFLDF